MLIKIQLPTSQIIQNMCIRFKSQQVNVIAKFPLFMRNIISDGHNSVSFNVEACVNYTEIPP